MAVLFGRSIVVPAGQIADCPAFIALFSEIMNAQKKVRQQVYQKSTYRPFLIGLEEAYVDYDDFVLDYRETVAPLANIGDQALARGTTREHQLKAMQRAYLERDYVALDKGHLGYGHFAKLVADEFGKGATSGTRPAHANRQRIFTGQQDGLASSLNGLLARLQAQEIIHSTLETIAEGIIALRRDIGEGDPLRDSLALRGSWYSRQARFEKAWDVARLWLDHALYREFTVRYDVQIPSYFLQEVEFEQHPLDITLAFAGDAVIDSIKDRQQTERPVIFASADRVDWETVWEMVADAKFQHSLCTMNAELDVALLEEERTIKAARQEYEADPIALSRRYERARQARQVRAAEAIDGHIDRMLSNLRDYLVTNSAGRLVVSMKRATRTVFSNRLMRLIAQGGSEGATDVANDQVKDGLKHFLAGPAGAESPSSSNTILSAAAGLGVSLASAAGGKIAIKAAAYTADWIMRPKEIFDHSIETVRAEKDRVNYWLGAAHYG